MPTVTSLDSKQVDAVIVGNGPSALILSYILHGHIPCYVNQHPDEYLHHALSESRDLLSFDASIFNHLRSSLKYSSQALPINVLLDTLLRPNGDVSDFSTSCVEWTYQPDRAVPHIVVGDASRAGGQWADNPVIASKDIGTLSYAEQLSLPGWSFAEYWQQAKGSELPPLIRPSRRDVADYYARYPKAVGISGSFQSHQCARDISRLQHGFHIASLDLTCEHLVLASGTFNINLPPPRSLRPIASAQNANAPVLVIGSGFTAADIIISIPPERQILHVFNWDPENRPSPLKGCHSQAYPEYAWIYRQMRLAAKGRSNASKASQSQSKQSRPKDLSSLPYFSQRDWAASYTGFPNGKAAACKGNAITDASATQSDDGIREVTITTKGSTSAPVFEVGSIQYAAGRRGSLDYLSGALLTEVMHSQPAMATPLEFSSSPYFDRLATFHTNASSDPDPWTGESDTQPPSPSSGSQSRVSSAPPSRCNSQPFKCYDRSASVATISGQAFRARIEETDSTEVAPAVFVIGSLTGDSLVRFAVGSCCAVAGSIVDRPSPSDKQDSHVPVEAAAINGTFSSNERHYNNGPLQMKMTSQSATIRVPNGSAMSDFHAQEHQPPSVGHDRVQTIRAKKWSGDVSCVVQ